MYPRRLIIADRSFAHVFFRCHNRSHFLKPESIKLFLLLLWAKNKSKYHIKIFDFIIMDNHAHMVVQAQSAEHLGRFMRTVNSQLARFINSYFDRDSQAIRERYKSPVITNARYLLKSIEYVWFNRYQVSKVRPDRDPYCSASWRLNIEVVTKLSRNTEKQDLLKKLLDSYRHLPVDVGPSRKFVRDLLNAVISKASGLSQAIFENSHTIGDDIDVRFRGELLSAFRRENVPWPLV